MIDFLYLNNYILVMQNTDSKVIKTPILINVRNISHIVHEEEKNLFFWLQ